MRDVRPRFNAKARQSSSKAKTKSKQASDEHDPNAEVVLPRTKAEKDLDKKEQMRLELIAQSDSKMNSKKKKRLAKYIEKKLKKEERVAILKKLSESQAELPTTLNLLSSSTLGTGRVSTHQRRLERLEDKEVKRALDGRVGKRKRLEAQAVIPDDEESDQSEAMELDEQVMHTRTQPPHWNVGEGEPLDELHVSGPSVTYVASPPVGSALQRYPDGWLVQPSIKERDKGTKTAFRSWGAGPTHAKEKDANASDTSFDSSDSAYDSSDGEEAEMDGENVGRDSAGPVSTSRDRQDTAVLPASKRSGFKDWALKQLSVAKGYMRQPSGVEPPPALDAQAEASPPPVKKQRISYLRPGEVRGPLGEEIHLPSTALSKQLRDGAGKLAKAVSITRSPAVEEERLLLPIVAEEQPIMEAVMLNSVVIICGETGSGKTTQVPQFLYEAGFGSPGGENPGMIGITQPRRVAAISMASRVAHELSLSSSRVSYQIRYDATVSPATSIKFMTDGVLLRELATDFLLTKYSVVIIDEAHERSMNTDILIGVVSRVIKLREEIWQNGKDDVKPLRLIIMSATLRVADFAENKTLFPVAPPIINISARQHSVTIHFNRRTASDYVTEAVKKASKIHSKLPPGGILIFLTGQNEITGVCRKLEAKYGRRALAAQKRRRMGLRLPDVDVGGVEESRTVLARQANVEAEEGDLGEAGQDCVAFDLEVEAENYDAGIRDSDDEGSLDDELGVDVDEAVDPMHVVPLYSLLPSETQMRVFQPPPAGTRLVVVATNVAETSLTIPGIRYVIDCGRAKERRYDVTNGLQAFQITWISKASAAQRAGRAGRTGPGHCYRLYSSAVFEHHFEPFLQPEILRMPIEGVVLQMKSMNIDAVVNFPFPTPPDRQTLRKAETVLTHLGALACPATLSGSRNQGGHVLTDATVGGKITDLGRSMSLFPLSPRFSRMLVSGHQHGCLPYVISIVSALSVGDPFLHEDHIDEDGGLDNEMPDELAHLSSEAVKAKEARQLRRKMYFQAKQTHGSLGHFTSDMFEMLSVVGAYEYAGGGLQFCSEHFVRPKAMDEIHKLRAQITKIVQAHFPDIKAGFVAKLRPPNDLQLKVLKQLLTAGLIDQVAVRKDLVNKDSSNGAKFATCKGVPYRAVGISEDVYIHPSSVIMNRAPPEYVVFHDVIKTSQVWIKGLTIINPNWLSSLGKGSLCTFSKPLKNRQGISMVTPHFGPERWELSPIKADMQ